LLLYIKHRWELFNHFTKLSKNWFEVLLSVYNIKKNKNLICYLRNGISFFVQNPSDIEAIIENFVSEWGHGYFSKFKEITPNNSIIDIGAHIGTFTIFMGNKHPHLKIFSFEPDPHNFKLLQKNIEINKQTNVKAFNLAVADKKKSVKLFPKLGRGFGTMGSNIINEGSAFNEIQSISLLDILEENKIETCDLLKMDCEGAEYEILLNQDHTCFDRINNIVMEYHIIPNLDYNLNDLIPHLEKYGFHVVSYPRNKNYGFLLATKTS